nr:ribonuclease H-like domain-containing protein [Tanacetum cinerariifolium]
MSDHEDETITEENAHPKVVPQITAVTNIYAKFPYLKKGEYDIWAMKMKNLISSSDLLCWNIVLKGNNAKSMTTDNDGNLKIRPPVTAEEHQQVQREEKAKTILPFALPDEHMGDFYHMIDARDIWNAIKARFGGNVESKKMQKSLLKQKFEEFKISEEDGLDKGYDKMQKNLTQMNTLKITPEPEDVNMKFLRGLPPFWSGIALILKTKGELEYISFDDLYNKLKFLEIDTKEYSLSSSTLSNAAFVSTVGSSQSNLSYQESENGGYTTTLYVSSGSSSSKGSSKSKCSVVDDVIYSFFANHAIDQHLVYKDLDQMNKEEFEEYDLKYQMAMLSIKVHRFEKKHGRKIKFNGRENARFDKKLVKCFNCKQMGHFSRECRAQGGQNSNNYQKYKSKEARKDGSDSKAMVVVDVPCLDRSSKPSTNDLQTYDSSMECSRPNQSDHDSTDSISSVSTPTSESRDTVVIDCDRQEDFTSVCSIETDEKSSKTLCNKFGSFNKESRFRKHKSVASKSCYVCGSYLHLIKDCDLHEQRFAKRNAERKGILGRRPTGKPINPNRSKPVSAGQQNPVSAGPPNLVSTEQQNIIFAGQPNPVSAGQQNPVSAGEATLACNSIPLSVYAGDGILELVVLILLQVPKLQHPLIQGSKQDDSDSDDEPDVLIIQSTPTPVVPIVDEATTQNDGTEEADRLGLAFPSLNLILVVGSASIGSSISVGSTPPVSAGSTSLMSP